MGDFLMHIFLHYYHVSGRTREDKVQKVLQSIGSSILLGGFSTFLGTIPLAFSTTEVFKSCCYCFVVMVVLGIIHGLVLLPVVLSYWGPLINIVQPEANDCTILEDALPSEQDKTKNDSCVVTE